MSKKTKLTVLFTVAIVISIILVSFLFTCVIPFKTLILIDAIPGTDDTEIQKLTEDLNGYYANVYDYNGYTIYIIEVYAPLKDILKADKLLENPNIVDVIYEWQFERPVSPMYTHM